MDNRRRNLLIAGVLVVVAGFILGFVTKGEEPSKSDDVYGAGNAIAEGTANGPYVAPEPGVDPRLGIEPRDSYGNPPPCKKRFVRYGGTVYFIEFGETDKCTYEGNVEVRNFDALLDGYEASDSVDDWLLLWAVKNFADNSEISAAVKQSGHLADIRAGLEGFKNRAPAKLPTPTATSTPTKGGKTGGGKSPGGTGVSPKPANPAPKLPSKPRS